MAVSYSVPSTLAFEKGLSHWDGGSLIGQADWRATGRGLPVSASHAGIESHYQAGFL